MDRSEEADYPKICRGFKAKFIPINADLRHNSRKAFCRTLTRQNDFVCDALEMPGRIPMTAVRITCIDDNTTNLRLLEKSLGDNFEMQLIESPHDAIQALQVFKPQAVLLDVNMPELNGYEICRRIRADASIADIPVIFLSCMTELEDRLSGYAAGGDAYVTKPFELRELKSILPNR